MIIEAATAGIMYMADAGTSTNPANLINPISIVVTVSDKVINYVEEKNKPKPKLAISQKKIDKFKKWEKEDFIKDDPYKKMWDKDWIRK